MSINKGPIPQCLLPPVKPKSKSQPKPTSVPEPEKEAPVPVYKTIMVKPSEKNNSRESKTVNRSFDKKKQKEYNVYPSAREANNSPVPVTTRQSNNDTDQTFPFIRVEQCDESQSKRNKMEVVTEYLAPVLPTRSRSSCNLAPPSPLLERRSGKLVSVMFPQGNLLSSMSKSEGNIPDAVFGGYSRYCGSTENMQSEKSDFKTISRCEGRISPDVNNLVSNVQRPRSPISPRVSPTNDVRSKYLKSFSVRDLD